MCVYCVLGDHFFKYDPPFRVDPVVYPTIPQPLVPQINPWDLARLKEYLELLQEVKALEDRLGCPCVPNKADYIALMKERIAQLEKKPRRKRKP